MKYLLQEYSKNINIIVAQNCILEQQNMYGNYGHVKFWIHDNIYWGIQSKTMKLPISPSKFYPFGELTPNFITR